MKDSEDDVILLIESESTSSHENVLDVDSSLPGVCVEGEECVNFRNVFNIEDGIFGGNVLGENGLEILGLDIFSAHQMCKLQFILIFLELFSEVILKI